MRGRMPVASVAGMAPLTNSLLAAPSVDEAICRVARGAITRLPLAVSVTVPPPLPGVMLTTLWSPSRLRVPKVSLAAVPVRPV
jgi:hypothetical protein